MSKGKMTRGTTKAVPCPHCKKPNDLTNISDYGIEAGNVFFCDHCKRRVQIVKMQPTTLVWCRKFVGTISSDTGIVSE